MIRKIMALPSALVGLVLLHEAALWALFESDVPSVLFAPGSHSPAPYLALTVGFIGLRLLLYFVAPFFAAAWIAARILELLSAAAARKASVDASRSPATQWQTTAPDYPADLPRASRPRSSR